MHTVLIVFFMALLASFIQRVSGFGFGIVIMTVLPHLLPSYGEATALSGLLAIVTSLIPALQMRKNIPWKKLIPILLTFLAVSYVAVRLVSGMDNVLLKKILGVVLIVVSLYFLFLKDRVRLPASLSVQIGMGTLSGMMGGLFAMQGPPAVIYFITSARTKEEYISMTQWYFLIGNLMMTFYRADSGFVTPVVGRLWCVGFLAVFIGLWLGGKVYARIKVEVLRKIVYAFLAVAGVVALL